MDLELMIRRGLYGCAQFVAVNIEVLAESATRNSLRRPRIDCKLNKDHSFGVEEKEDFIQPVYDLRSMICPGRLEVPLLNGAEIFRIDKNTDQAFRCLDQSVLARCSPSQDSDIRRVLQQL